ncbi:MAG: hypothetical protein HY225_03835 [Candidatus Vogelbacteria bacterium]|nr:hypothetical protein [Candidatus Vogelbacteria bacterium]
MKERIEAEVALIRRFYLNAEYHEAGWIRIPDYRLPEGIWNQTVIEVLAQFPIPGYPGQAPYGIHVRPCLRLKGLQMPTNYTEPVGTPFGDNWGKFSWQPEGWRPTADLYSGSNMLDFIRTFIDRFREVT